MNSLSLVILLARRFRERTEAKDLNYSHTIARKFVRRLPSVLSSKLITDYR